jgi:hypothetical protein
LLNPDNRPGLSGSAGFALGSGNSMGGGSGFVCWLLDCLLARFFGRGFDFDFAGTDKVSPFSARWAFAHELVAFVGSKIFYFHPALRAFWIVHVPSPFHRHEFGGTPPKPAPSKDQQHTPCTPAF